MYCYVNVQVFALKQSTASSLQLSAHEIYDAGPFSQWTMDSMLLSTSKHERPGQQQPGLQASSSDSDVLVTIGLSDNAVEVHHLQRQAASMVSLPQQLDHDEFMLAGS